MQQHQWDYTELQKNETTIQIEPIESLNYIPTASIGRTSLWHAMTQLHTNQHSTRDTKLQQRNAGDLFFFQGANITSAISHQSYYTSSPICQDAVLPRPPRCLRPGLHRRGQEDLHAQFRLLFRCADQVQG